MPIGATCGSPAADEVVTMVSWIMRGGGPSCVRRRLRERGPRCVPRGEILRLARHRASPFERPVLHVALAELPRDLRARELDTEIERVSRVAGEREVRVQRERI